MRLDFTKKEVDFFKENCYFSDEEERILELRLRGKSNQQIADELHHSLKTINNRIASIKKKIIRVL